MSQISVAEDSRNETIILSLAPDGTDTNQQQNLLLFLQQGLEAAYVAAGLIQVAHEHSLRFLLVL